MLSARTIKARIQQYTDDIAVALDNNNAIEAIKLRAKQRELEDIISIGTVSNNLNNFNKNEYYTQQETQKKLKLSQSQISKLKNTLGAIKTNDRRVWYPKSVVDEYKENKGIHHR